VPIITELRFALGLGSQVVARTGCCVQPHDAVRGVPKVGGTKDPDLARLASLHPTHLIVNVDENRREVVDAARTFVPNIVVTHPQRLLENPRLYRLVGAIFGRETEAQTLCGRFMQAHRSLEQAVHAVPRERVLYIIWKRPWMTVSRDTYIADTLGTAGWDVVAPGGAMTNRYPEIEEDDEAWRRAQRILLSTEPYAFRQRDVALLAQARGQPVHLVDGEMTSWYGPRAIAGMDYLARLRATLD